MSSRTAFEGWQITTFQHDHIEATFGTDIGNGTTTGTTADHQQIRLFCEHGIRT
jgi:hypothetical protein